MRKYHGGTSKKGGEMNPGHEMRSQAAVPRSIPGSPRLHLKNIVGRERGDETMQQQCEGPMCAVKKTWVSVRFRAFELSLSWHS